MSFQPLKGMTVIDLTHRLPGPLCGKILTDLGANVIKIEDHVFKDPFLSGLFASLDSSFLAWYENLNIGKKIERFDFNSSDDQKKIHDMVIAADAVLMGIPVKTREKLHVTDPELNLKKPMVVIELLASEHEKKSMHDLNALAMTGLLSLYVADKKDKIVDPPFLPIAGISFGHKAATDLLAAYVLATKKNETQFVKTYMDQVTRELLGIFWPDSDRKSGRTKFLHNGIYPCYTLYQTKDCKYVALAAVEEKFWNRFCEVFKIKSSHDRFYNKDQSLFEIISKEIQKYNVQEIELLIKDEDLCLSVIY
ncbi:MAG: CoA transferase [Bacteriovorax sp.]|jgi:crotonobetainyl-CoA:carnitine CoA-transferase CaiB-like acyl-CoA transferase